MDCDTSEHEISWLKVGLYSFKKNEDYPYSSVSTDGIPFYSNLPHVINDEGLDVTPKPLFAIFHKQIEKEEQEERKRSKAGKGDGVGVKAPEKEVEQVMKQLEDMPSAQDKEKEELLRRDTIEELWNEPLDDKQLWKEMLVELLGAAAGQKKSVHAKPVEQEQVSVEETTIEREVAREQEDFRYDELLKLVDPRELTRSLRDSDPFAVLLDANEQERRDRERRKLEAEQLKNLEAYFIQWERAAEELKKEEPLVVTSGFATETIPKFGAPKQKEIIASGNSFFRIEGDSPIASPSIEQKIEYSRKTVVLTESDVIMCLELVESTVAPDSIDYYRVAERNELYERTVEKYQEMKDDLHDVGVQVPKPVSRDAMIATVPFPTFANNGGMINEYLYYLTSIGEDVQKEEEEEILVRKVELNDIESFVKYLEQNKKELLPKLHYLEKAMNKNSYSQLITTCIEPESVLLHSKVTSQSKTNAEDAPHLNHLLTVSSSQGQHKRKHAVLCICFNYTYPYYFAAGFDTKSRRRDDTQGGDTSGYIICWDIRHFQVPEVVFHTPEVVTCLEFSRSNPYLLLAGMRHGLLAIFDISQTDDKPQVHNYFSADRPYGNISGLQWFEPKVAKGVSGTNQTFIMCVTVDGAFYQWCPGTGAHRVIIKTGGRIATGSSKSQDKVDVTASVPYLCLDINPKDQKIGLVGCLTGEIIQSDLFGSLICCHQKHVGPVYGVRWSPHVNDVFISCGFDSSICLWGMTKNTPFRTFNVRQEAVIGVDWSNASSTLFGAVTHSNIRVYDMSLNTVNEVIEHTLQKAHEVFTCIAFFPHGNWFFVGRSDGVIEVYDVVNVPISHDEPEKALKSAFLA